MSHPLPPTSQDVDAIAAWSVIRAARALARRLADELAPHGLTPVEFGVLVQLAASGDPQGRGGLAQADLARAVGVRPQSMTVMTRTLAERGLVDLGERRGRGRRSAVVLTDDGRRLLSRAYPVVLASNDWFGPDPATAPALVVTLRPLLGPAEQPAPHVP
ncbi:MarR family winged helix-turn-helix transcriptional regulator [Lapillicoccus jejuensis]|uniref:DNA-binding MarR family transcriptional regulator n=1 Tax=Lapillicoccus jejuensis TaxID=402171 RepID=A0A542E6G0_9MICO|nr:MarR family transcriptional regulator [Lapillicoccus jejuensis]TQJ10856.1 DNA-binding MarR family transcriptional regulator [Lapillicoccus jejuensis]